ncbi:hypothetical protein DPMN_007194 [Dreissena polymorpha]|uniref:CARD domain-containing protein n=1 Tax=Dreissena polymorpha TaxID=45954 RepID=A0A9D4MW38_DREPO|nr:hypothetical protein DPMN_007194 [Dreissena polymorpha]
MSNLEDDIVNGNGSDKLEKTLTETGSKDDENLMHNWSLTFNEYADQNGYGDPGNGKQHSEKESAVSTIASDTVTGKPPDGRGHAIATLKTGKVIKDTRKYVEVDADTKKSEKSDSIPDDTATGSMTLKDSIDNDRDGNISPTKTDEIMRTANGKQDTPELSKYTVLPGITNKSQTLVNAKPTVVVPPATTALSLGATSGNKAPRNTPATGHTGGKVQQIYVRFPGQRTGQMMFAEMDQQSGHVRIVGLDKEKEMLARLAWLLLDAGTSALRATFDSIHPPLNLREHLKQAHVKAVLQKLLQQSVLTERQWKLLYPIKKKHSTSQAYDSRTLIILLETICHLCPPYPNGWAREPLPNDGSLSADIVRLQLLYLDMARHEGIAGESYVQWFLQIRDVIVRLGGPPIRLKIDRIETELINLELQQHYIKTLRETWQPDLIQKLEKVHGLRSKTSRARKAYANTKGSEEGLSAEDRVVLKKVHKLLVENVQADDVIDRLQQSQVLKFSDRQDILATSKKQERTQILLDKIADSKLPYALKALFDAMKFKYKKLYDHVMAVRKQTYKEGVVTTIDVEGITEECLRNQYKSRLSRVYPFPWTDSVYGSVRDVYTSLDIVDTDGNKLSHADLLPLPATSGKGSRIIFEGTSGSGKSIFCAWLAFMWATQPSYFRAQYRHVLYLNMSEMNGNLETAVYKSLFPENFKITLSDFWKMLERSADEVLLMIDDYVHDSDIDITDILLGTRLKECTVLLTSKPHTKLPNGFVADCKWFNLGFNEGNIRRCFRNCVSISDLEHDQFEKLYHLSGRESWPLRSHLANPMMAVMAFGVYSILRKGTMLREMKTTCDLLEKYGVAMATLYCRKQKIDIVGFEFPDEVMRAIDALDQFAFSCVMNGRRTFSEDDVVQKTGDTVVLKFGAFSKFTQSSMLRFACGISMDFLAARHIADMSFEDIETTVMKNKIVKLPKFAQLMSFICGQYREDTDTSVLISLFDQLAARNEYCIRGLYLPATTLQSPVSVESELKTKRLDAVQTVAQSLPQRLIIRSDGLITLKTTQGLCLALEHKDCTVQEIELDLHQYHNFQLPVFLALAGSTSRCRNIHSIKITWSSLDTMSRYLAAVMEQGKSVETLYITEDHTRKCIPKHVSAVTWAAMQSACNHMTSVQHLSFLNARVTAVLNHVLQHIPTTIAHINITGCAFNLMCAGQIASHLHGNTMIRHLDLSNTKLNSSELVAIFQGMQMCDGIQTVRMRGARLDRPCIVALAEYIKLTHSLENLDLSDCELNTAMCTALVAAIKQNRTIKRLVFNNTKLTSEGRRVIAKTETRLNPVSVEGLLRLY